MKVGIADEYRVEVKGGEITKANTYDIRSRIKRGLEARAHARGDRSSVFVLIDALSNDIPIPDDLDVLVCDLRFAEWAKVERSIDDLREPANGNMSAWAQYLRPQFEQSFKVVEKAIKIKNLKGVVSFSTYWDEPYRSWIQGQQDPQLRVLGTLAEHYSSMIDASAKARALPWVRVARYPSPPTGRPPASAAGWADFQRTPSAAETGLDDLENAIIKVEKLGVQQ